MLEEIVVTARKRSENLQEIPLSVTAFSANGIRDLDIRSVYDLVNATANFSFDKTFGRRFDRPVIRGQSTIQGDPNASFFVDGVFVSGSITGTSTDALERIEILRGPQSALYGRATFSGAVNYISKQPTDEFDGQINGRIGSHSDYKGALWMRGAIVPSKLQFFIAGNWEYYGGQYRNDLPAVPVPATFITAPTRSDTSRVGNEDTKDFTAKLRFLATDNVQFNIKANYSDTNDGHFASVFVRGDELNCFRPGIDAGTPATARGYYCGEIKVGNRKPHLNLPDFVDGVTTAAGTSKPRKAGNQRQVWRWVGDMQADVNDWNFLAQATYNTDTANFESDGDRTSLRPNVAFVLPANGAFQTHVQENYVDHSFEGRIAAPDQERIHGLAGIYYFKQQFKTHSRSFTGANPNFSPTGADYTTSHVRNLAGFAQIAGDVTDQLSVTVEGRYAGDKKDAFAVGGRAASKTFKSFTPRLTVDFKATDDSLIYAYVSKGNKPGGFNTGLFSPTGVSNASFQAAIASSQIVFNEEKAWNYELGTKNTLMDGRATLNADVYYIDWKGQQLTNIINITNPQGGPTTAAILVNLGATKVRGTEIEATVRATEELTLGLTYGLADSSIRAYDDDEIRITTGRTDPTLANGGNAKGKQLPLSPKHSLNLTANWRQPLAGDVDWFLGTNMRYESKKYTEVANYQWTGDIYIWNARLGVENESWNLALYANNMLDDRTPNGSLRFVDVTFPNFSGGSRRGFDLGLRRGREFGLTGQYSF